MVSSKNAGMRTTKEFYKLMTSLNPDHLLYHSSLSLDPFHVESGATLCLSSYFSRRHLVAMQSVLPNCQPRDKLASITISTDHVGGFASQFLQFITVLELELLLYDVVFFELVNQSIGRQSFSKLNNYI